MKRSIYSKTFKYLKINFRENKEVLSDLSTLGRSKEHNIDFQSKEEVDLSEWNIDKEEEFILKNLYQFIEEGYDLNEGIEIMSKQLNLEKIDIFEKIENIKEKQKRKLENER